MNLLSKLVTFVSFSALALQAQQQPTPRTVFVQPIVGAGAVSATDVTNIVNALAPAASTGIATNAGSGTNNILKTPTIVDKITVLGQSGAGTLSIGDGVVSNPSISPFGGNGSLLFSVASGAGIYFYDRLSGAAPHVTIFEDLRPGGAVNNVGPWSFWPNNMIESISPVLPSYAGVAFTSYADSHGGSVGGAKDLPVSGNEIVDNCQKPYFVLAISDVVANATNCTWAGLTNTVNRFMSNGWGILTNISVPIAVQLENYWLTNHRTPVVPSAGNTNWALQWNTAANKWPLATNPTNVTYYLRTNSIETWLMMYADTFTPTSNNSEYDIDAVTGNTFWEWPNGANGIPGSGSLMQPMITPASAHADATSFYQWDVGGVTLQDATSAHSGTAGAFEQIWNTFGHGILHPAPLSFPSVTVEFNWAYYYPYRMGTHGLIANYLYPPVYMPYPMSSEYKVNGMALESGTFPTEVGSVGVLRQMISMMRPGMYNLTNWQPKTTFYCLNSDQLMYSDWSYNDCKSFLSGVAMMGTHEWIRSNNGGALTNVNLLTLSTNANYIKIWQDTARNRLNVIRWGSSNGIVSKVLGNGEVAAWFWNLDPTGSTNLTASWADLKFASNYPVVITDSWTNTTTSLTNSYTLTVPASNSTMVIFSPVYANGVGLSNYLSTAANRIVANGLATLVSGTNKVTSTSANATNIFSLAYYSRNSSLSTLAITNITADTDFLIQSGNTSDTNQVFWSIIKP